MSNEAVFKYDDRNPGRITSDTGLDVGQHVVVEYRGQRVDLKDIIRFGSGGYISKIEMSKNGGVYDYRITAVGSGPSSGYGYTYYTDGEPDTYSLKFYDSKEHSDYVRFNSKNHRIRTITWEPVGKIIGIPDEAEFTYDDKNPGCITSNTGLQVGQHVVVKHNGKRVELKDIIKFGSTGYVSKIEMKENGGTYDYRIEAVGAGPSSGYGYTYYTDGEPDTYSLKFYDSKEHSDYVRFNSKKPVIRKITWEPTGKAIDTPDEAVFIYDDKNPGCITSETGLQVGQHVVVYHNNQQVDLQSIMRFGEDGYISKIEMKENGGTYDYRIDAVGAGPSSGYGYTYYTDDEPDTYSLKFYDHKEHSDYVRFNSKKPVIRKITWEPIGKNTGIPWMKQIADNTPINKLSIPGTHDTLTWNFTNTLSQIVVSAYPNLAAILLTERVKKFCKAQNANLKEQLIYGCRYLDIRIDENLQGCHGQKIVGADCKYNLRNVMDDVKDFLTKHPTEAIIMRIKKEREEVDSDKINAVINQYKDLFWKRSENTNTEQGNPWPLMADVRGKVIVLDSLNGSPFYSHADGYGFDFPVDSNDKFNFQDKYDAPEIDYKFDLIKKYIDENDQKKLTINHVSATGLTKDNLLSGGLLYKTPGEYADNLNPRVVNYLESKQNCITGLLIFDYITLDIVNTVISKNPI